ncbi:hypothetical protein AgCh_014408 [Apium graveolens]
MEKKILSLTTSSSGYARNWSTFEGNERSGYVQFNSKFLKKKKKKERHDILLADVSSMAQAWIAGVDEDDVESQNSTTNIADEMFHDLDEDNFELEDETVI